MEKAKAYYKTEMRSGRLPSPLKKATPGSAGWDLSAFLDRPVEIRPGERALIPTGIYMALPEGCCAFVMARSGLAHKRGVRPSNCVGLIDSDYRGEITVSLENGGTEPFLVEDGMRIAQLVVFSMPELCLEPSPGLDETIRGRGGFGSTGTDKL